MSKYQGVRRRELRFANDEPVRNTFRQSMAWLHTWVGLVAAWVLFFVFVTGTLSYVRFEIDRWMMPEKPMATSALPAVDTVPRAFAWLAAHAPDAQSWTLIMPARRTGGELVIWWAARPGAGDGGNARLDPATGRPATMKARDTGGGGHLYEMHYSLHYIPYEIAVRIIGVCTMAMLIALISGIVVHKKLFRDFFTFRPGKGQRSWLDIHNLFGVTALPFHLMITWSGLVIFLFTYMPAPPAILYGDQGQQVMKEAFPSLFASPLPDAPRAASAPIGPMLQAFGRARNGEALGWIMVNAPGRINAEVVLHPQSDQRIGEIHDAMTFNGATGALLKDARPPVSAAAQTYDVLLGLHIGDFAGPLLRVLYVFAGLASSAMIATGLVLWTAKRRTKQGESLGFRFVETLNIGVIAGLPVAIAAYFWANRLLPLDFPERHDWEVHAMFLAWAAMLVWPVWRTPARAWSELMTLAAGAYGFIPLLNAFTTDRHLAASIPAGDWVMAGFDLIALAVGAVFAVVAWRMHGKAIRAGGASGGGGRTTSLPAAG